ncbi:hypothetical protein KC363_g163 [Hortaea werneckii]|nr:hypothetical protein KC363_g163 [Hortaea werneckii]
MAQVVLHEPTETWRRPNGRDVWRDLYIFFSELSHTIGIRDIVPPAQSDVSRWMFRRALWRAYRRYHALFRRWEHHLVLRELFPRTRNAGVTLVLFLFLAFPHGRLPTRSTIPESTMGVATPIRHARIVTTASFKPAPSWNVELQWNPSKASIPALWKQGAGPRPQFMPPLILAAFQIVSCYVHCDRSKLSEDYHLITSSMLVNVDLYTERVCLLVCGHGKCAPIEHWTYALRYPVFCFK